MSDAPQNPIPRSPSFAEAEALVKQRAAIPAGPGTPVNPRAAEEFEFTVEVIGGDGKPVPGSGTFRNRILTNQEQIDVGLLASVLVNGVTFSSLPADTRERAMIVAHLRTSLVTAPKEFNLSLMRNERLLTAVWGEVNSHETYFRGPPSPEKSGQG